MDIAALPIEQINRLEVPLEQNQGSIHLMIALTPCSGVSISDLCVCPLADPGEKEQIRERYVSIANSDSLKYILMIVIIMHKASLHMIVGSLSSRLHKDECKSFLFSTLQHNCFKIR